MLLQCEPTNKFDSNAIKVYSYPNIQLIGYLTANDAENIVELFDCLKQSNTQRDLKNGNIAFLGTIEGNNIRIDLARITNRTKNVLVLQTKPINEI